MAQVQNLLRYSEDLTKTIAWSVSDCVASSAMMISDTNDAIAKYHFVYQSASYGNAPLTISVSAKAGTKSWLCFDVNGALIAYFDVGNGALGTIQSSAFKCSIVPDPVMGAGWYRCTMTYTPTRFLESFTFIMANGNTAASYQGDGTGTIYLTRMQLTSSNHAGPYVKTELGKIDTGNIRCLAQPYTLVNILTDGNMEATNPAVPLVDGNMEATDTSAWTAGNNASLAKSTTNPHSGTRSLVVDRTTSDAPFAYQTILTIGKVYRVQGWAKGDGTVAPVLTDGPNAVWTGTSSTSWQPIDVTFLSAGTTLRLIASNYTGVSHPCEFDGITIVDLTAGSYTSQAAILSKQTASPHSGSQCLRVKADGTQSYAIANQPVTQGKRYRVTGWARSDGTRVPRVYLLNGASWVGTASTGWQRFDIAGVSNAGALVYFGHWSNTGYVEFDDIEVIDLFTTPTRQLAQPYPTLNLLIDGDMEATNAAPAATDLNMDLADTSAWTSSNATLSKQSGARTGGSGSRVLRVAANGAAFGYASQANGLINGHVYHITGWFRGDGVNASPVLYGGGTQYATGTTSNAWQSFDVIATQTTNNSLNPYGSFPGSVGYVEFDDLVITDITAGAYTAGDSALLYKVTTNPHSGSQALRVAYNSVSYPYARQLVFTVGKPYLVRGFARGDGSKAPKIFDSTTAAVLWSGTSSTTWQPFAFEFIPGVTAGCDFYAYTTSAGYVDFDDIQVIDLTSTPQRQLAQPYTLINKLVDGDMEATNAAVGGSDWDMEALDTSVWTPGISGATLSKVAGSLSGTGSRKLRVTSTGSGGFAYQSNLILGHTYRFRGWAAGDGGTGIPSLRVGGGGTFWTGTNSISPQYFDVVATVDSSSSPLLNNSGGAGTYADFDDIVINDVTAGSYTAYQSIVSKSIASPHSGAQALRVAYDGSHAYGAAYQIILTAGKRYRVTGWARGDGGVALPMIAKEGSAVWSGTASAAWQRFDFDLGPNIGTAFYLQCNNLAAGRWVEFDDVQVIDLSATPTRFQAPVIPPVNVLVDGNQEATNSAVPLVDGNMEAAGIAAWLNVIGTTSKSSASPHSGGQSLRITATGGVLAEAAQIGILQAGHVYRVKGWARGDGLAGSVNVIIGGSGTTQPVATLSNTWQQFDITGLCSGAASLYFYSAGLTNNTGYAEYDDITITDVTAALDWLVYGDAIVSKRTETPHSGSQCLRFTYGGTPGWGGYKALTVGHRYLFKGWMRGDGVRAPIVYDFGTGAVLVTGTISTEWQYFEKAFCDVGALTIYLSSSAGYVEFDDLELIDLTLTPARMTA
ncbi:MAG: hypothetical protein PHC53_02650 [Patescibacteria group bacterium]|nr:hypothetical protein [Patescibacteria group bacterium]